MILSLVPTARRRTVGRSREAREVLDTAVASPTKLSLPNGPDGTHLPSR